MKSIVLVVPWLLALCVQQPTPPSAERKLTFNWPVGIEVRIETEHSRLRLETDTMLPHELVTEQTINMVTEWKGGRSEVKAVDRRSSRFIY